MAGEHHWRELRGGIIASVAIAVLVTVILVFARVGGLRGKKVTLYVLADDATGVLPGTEVWLAGRKSGLVTKVEFRPPSTDTTERLLVTTEFLESALPNVRTDSYAQIRAGGSLIGTPVVYVAAGSARARGLHDGDTLHTRNKVGLVDVTSQVGKIGPAISELAAEVKSLHAQATHPPGTIGLFAERGLPAMPEFSASMSRIASKANGTGTIGLARRRNLMGRASRVMAQTDSIKTLMTSGKGSIGRFRRDTTLMTKVKGIMAELDTLKALVSNPVASIGGAHADSALIRELARRRALMDSLKADVKKRPRTYINF